MKILKQIDPNTRIVVKRFYWRALATAIVLERKGKWRWRGKAWTYPSIMRGEDPEFIEEWLLWSEAEPRTGRDLALRLFGKLNDEEKGRDD